MQNINTMTNLTSLQLTYASCPLQAGSFLPQLQELTRLHTLELRHYKQPQLTQGNFPALRKLVVQDCHLNVCDISSYTQLTSLKIDCNDRPIQQLLLPVGSTVNLQHLLLLGDPGEPGIHSLHNLHAATQLFYLNLTRFQEPPLQLESLQQLQRLKLDLCSMATCDLSSATHLTKVLLYWRGDEAKVIRLPIGSSVQLQHLKIWLLDRAHHSHALYNLAGAHKMTYLEFRNTYPTSMDQLQWPALMPALQVFKADMHMSFAPVEQFVGCTTLRQLKLGRRMVPGVTADKYSMSVEKPADFHCLPEWSSQLTRLTKLEDLGICANLRQFPTAVLQLKQLCSLDLSNNDFDRHGLPADIMVFTTFTALMSLDMQVSAFTKFTQKSVQHVRSEEGSNRRLVLAEMLGPGVLRY